MRVHDVEINFPKNRQDLSIKIDGQEFGPTCGITIKSPCASHDGTTTVELRFHAEVRGKVHAEKLSIMQMPIKPELKKDWRSPIVKMLTPWLDKEYEKT